MKIEFLKLSEIAQNKLNTIGITEDTELDIIFGSDDWGYKNYKKCKYVFISGIALCSIIGGRIPTKEGLNCRF